MTFVKINSDTDFSKISALIKPHKMGFDIMKEKTKIHFVLIKNISSGASNILKQDALRVGAELVTNKDVINKNFNSNALLMATKEQILKLIQKEQNQPFELAKLAQFLKNEFNKPKKPLLMAVLNINQDSFYENSRANEINFQSKLEELLELKADYIDIGAVSSRPGSFYCGQEEEFKRLKKILDLIYKNNLYKKSIFSLDSFNLYCLEYALNSGFLLVNDITGLEDENVAKLALKYKSKYCLMHMQNKPHNMQDKPFYEDLIQDISLFFTKKLEILNQLGLDDVILDPGIGFGKTHEHNLLLIKHLEHFLMFKKPILIGASRKSMINSYFKSEANQRLSGSLFLHLKAFENGASIIRTHDLFEHKQFFALNEAYCELGV